MNRSFALPFVVAAMLSLGQAHSAPQKPWFESLVAPMSASAPAQLPRLQAELKLDGDLSEWQGAATVPMRSKSFISWAGHYPKLRSWDGPSDAGGEMYLAWSDKGLCLAAEVSDNEVINTRTGEDVWEMDGLQFCVDGRPSSRLMRPPYSLGAYQLLVRPPADGKPSEIAVSSRHNTIAGLQVAGHRTNSGYVVEVMVPWEAFPDITPGVGTMLGCAFTLDEYDARDGNLVHPLQLAHNGIGGLWGSPQLLIKWRLVDRIQTGPSTDLGPLLAIDAPGLLTNSRPLNIAVEAGRTIAADVRTIGVRVRNSSGRTVFKDTVRASSSRDPWNDCRTARMTWAPESLSDDQFTITATAYDSRDEALGFATRTIQYVSPSHNDQKISELKQINISRLSESEPFRAAAYLGIASSLEQMRQGFDEGNGGRIAGASRELEARLDILDNGRFDAEVTGVYELLKLSANPEAQVVVEYPRPREAIVSIYCGAIPIAGAVVTEFASEEAADAALKALDTPAGHLPQRWEATTVKGMQGRMLSQSYTGEDFYLQDQDPEKQVVLLNNRWGDAIDIGNLALANVKAAVILRECPQPIRETVESWAAKQNIPLMELQAARAAGPILIAGDARPLATTELKDCEFRTAIPTKKGALLVVSGKMNIFVDHPCEEVRSLVAGFISRGEPIELSDVDALREAALRYLGSDGPDASAGAGKAIFCGDLHTHTFFSDGTPSPVQLGLRSLYCFMDFVAVTDHNTIAGAQLGQKLFSKYGFQYSYIVGEEIGEQIHTNAYPLHTLIPKTDIPEEAIKAARSQNAAIQLNHPGWPRTEWARKNLTTNFADIGFDAWEHVPDRHDQWKKEGSLPVITGTSDTHNCLFGYFERTIALSPSPDGEDIAEAIRKGEAVAIVPGSVHVLYGSERNTSVVRSALANSNEMRDAKARQLRAALKNADVVGLMTTPVERPIAVRD